MLVTINSVFVTHVVTRPSVEEGQYAIDLDLANDRAKRGTRAALVERGRHATRGGADGGEAVVGLTMRSLARGL
jgi:hypothetical protein